ncbi:glycosyl hydrolase [Mycobacterium sp. PS03-16]|uniref:glycoside hydrolase family 3 C-terminal domain-containing protein n=1 Tax=Mycobacterium sp. PS03-16 TaxID=2559611 RepID=UPI00107498FD|nr:glycoside hydrolase family 3 C-terminal domain-containing protein [Mycobacterium sp. PS03-16]TFV57402.1 glycosyl hydrolase [Mycobacterium sp. PS03-16]
MDSADLSLDEQVSLLSGATAFRTRALPSHGVGSLLMADGPHGLRVPAGDGDHLGVGGSRPATCFPPAVTLAGSWDDDLAREVGVAIGVEARALGVDVVLGPGLNIKRHPFCGRNFEYFSEDPVLSGRMAAAVVDGIQRTGTGACLKHYAVNNQEGHRFVVDAVVDERTLRELYLAGFEYAVRASRPWTVMAAYNRVNGVYATEHRVLLTDILRTEWGFDGLVMSDWGAVSDRVRSLAAGLDLEMPGSAGLFDGEVRDAVRSGRLPAAAVAAAARRVADLAARAPRTAQGSIPVEEHDALAARVAAESTVLLRNDGTLPLTGTERVALIGAFAEKPRYQGSGSSLVTPTRVTSALAALRERGADVVYAPGYDAERSEPDGALIEQAVAVARDAQVAVVMVGLPAVHESEGFDRTTLALPEQHDALVAAVCAANPRTVVVLSNGAPVLMPWHGDAAAIVESYLGGQAGGAGLVAALHDDIAPGGRLAESFPAAQRDVAADRWFPGVSRQVTYREGLFVGYRHHVSSGVAPLFPFGHGLSYTEFAWTDAAVDRGRVAPGEGVTVTVRVTNVGARAGSDVVQIYLADRTGVVLRPERALAGYAKVRLAPGETRDVAVAVAPRAFEYYDVDAAGWRAPRGRYELLVARSSADVVHRLDVEVTGGVTRAAEPADTPAVAAADRDFVRRLGHPLPPVLPARPFTRDSTLGEFSATWAGRALMWVITTGALRSRATGADPAVRRMVERSIAEIPLRSVAIFSRGVLRLPVVDAVVALGNRDRAALAALVRRSVRRVTSR